LSCATQLLAERDSLIPTKKDQALPLDVFPTIELFATPRWHKFVFMLELNNPICDAAMRTGACMLLTFSALTEIANAALRC